MPLLVLLSLALQIACAVHVVRTGREQYWLWIILIGSYLGVIVYTIAVLIPDLRHHPRGRAAARQVLHTLDPERQRRHIRERLEMADTVDNRRALAQECLRLRDYGNAAELYQSMLKGVFADDASFLLGLAQAQAGQEDFVGARTTLDKLYAAHPDFRSNDAELLRARTLEALGEHAVALDHYRALSTSYPGEEARFRYGFLLKQAGRAADARAVFGDMLKRAKAAPRYYRRKEKGWLDLAQRELASL
ncbi:MAG: tetratricopeptide repeat protein [Gammaproteobacteria bacterium]|nr:MAG: tetratricopeptide repeat protein [Gammaproteobacteria bacterium]